MPSKVLDGAMQAMPIILAVIQVLRWIDAYRIATDVVLPVPLPWRVLLARYNLLAFCTHIYRAFEAMKKPTSGG